MDKTLKIAVYEEALKRLSHLYGDEYPEYACSFCCEALHEACFEYDTDPAPFLEEFATWCKPEGPLYPIDSAGGLHAWWPTEDRESRIAAMEKAVELAKQEQDREGADHLSKQEVE